MANENFQTWQVAEPWINYHCKLGEGPYYEKGTNSLRFVDIMQHRIHTVSLDEGPASLKTIQLDVPVSVTADIEGYDPKDKILVGLKHGLAVLDRKTEKYEYLTKFDENIRLRGNDGAADPHGRFWLGTMTDFDMGEFKPEGYLIRFDSNKTKTILRHNLTIPNSVGWSPDAKTMFFTHTTTNTISAFDYSPTDGQLSNERVFYQHDGSGGLDGFRVDVEGNIWHAIYGEARVIKISPAGKVVGEVKLPTRNITCVEFVGTELFITTAGDEDGEGGERSREFGGGVYRVEVGARGVRPFEFKLGSRWE